MENFSNTAVSVKRALFSNSDGYCWPDTDVYYFQVSYIYTYPVGQVDLSLVGDKLEHAAVCDAVGAPVGQLEQHRVDHVQSRQLVQRRWRHDDCPERDASSV